jgi:hypothetical protein
MIAIHDSVTEGQSDAGSRVFIATVQTFKEPQNGLLIFGIDIDAVVGN